jgi:hypothetical protein
MASGVVQWQYEKHLRRSHALAAKARAALHARKHPQDVHQTIMMNAIAKEEEEKIPKGIPWGIILAGAGVSLLAMTAIILFIELGVNKPVSALVQGKPGHGTSFSGGTVYKPPAHHHHHAPTPSAVPSTSLSPTPSATLSPSVAPSTPLSTPTPPASLTPTMSTAVPSASATAASGATPAPTPTF